MNLPSTGRLRTVLLHPHWLTAALSAALFFQFALNRGGVESAIWAAGILLGLHAVAGAYDPRALPRRNLLFLAACGGTLLVSWVFAPAATDPARTGRIVEFVILVLAVGHLARQSLGTGFRSWVTALTVAIVLWQFAVRHLTGSPYGTFANPHYLAYFSALLLPVLLLATSWLERPYRYLVYTVVLVDLSLVFNDLRKPTIPLLAIGAGLAAFGWSVAGRRVRWGVAALLIGLVGTTAVMVDDAQLGRLGLAAPSHDERMQIWADSLRMLRDNDAVDWLVGNGIGSFRNEFAGYFAPAFRNMPLPHNHVLELLYENGVVIATLFAGFLTYLAWQSLRLAGSLADGDLRRLARCNLALLAIWFVFSFLAFGVYSRYTLYPFGFIVGIFFFLMQVSDSRAAGSVQPSPSVDAQ